MLSVGVDDITINALNVFLVAPVESFSNSVQGNDSCHRRLLGPGHLSRHPFCSPQSCGFVRY